MLYLGEALEHHRRSYASAFGRSLVRSRWLAGGISRSATLYSCRCRPQAGWRMNLVCTDRSQTTRITGSSRVMLAIHHGAPTFILRHRVATGDTDGPTFFSATSIASYHFFSAWYIGTIHTAGKFTLYVLPLLRGGRGEKSVVLFQQPITWCI